MIVPSFTLSDKGFKDAFINSAFLVMAMGAAVTFLDFGLGKHFALYSFVVFAGLFWVQSFFFQFREMGGTE